MRILGPQPGGRFEAVNASLLSLIRNAYDVQREQMAPGRDLPSWIESERWDIIAKAPDVSDPSTIRAMLQRLLVDRFKMSFRWETRDLPVYAIVQDKPGRLGPALVRSTADCGTASCGMRSSRSPETGGTISGVSVTIPDLILRLAARDGDTPLSER